jgi:polyphosphate kinase
MTLPGEQPILMPAANKIINREISWLQFNERVLQEAADERNPLFERIKFLAIYSSNLDEFFRVRVASLRSLLSNKKALKGGLEVEPEKLLKKIHKIVRAQQEIFGKIFQTKIIPGLRKHRIHLVRESQLTPAQSEHARAFFRETVLPALDPVLLNNPALQPFLKNRALYFAIELALRSDAGVVAAEHEFAILEIPTDKLPRFYTLPKEGKDTHILFLDDVIRLSLKEMFPRHEVLGAYSFKLTRDAELHIEDEFQGDLLAMIKQSLGGRKKGVPSRFLYDPAMPSEVLRSLAKTFKLTEDDMIPGGRYHNFSDLMSFPNPGIASLENKPLPTLSCAELADAKTIFSAIETRDVLVTYPYQSYDYVIRFIREAAADASVIAVKITLYRVANNSEVVEALKECAKAGKEVTAFVEIKARFDEERNLFWAGELERGGRAGAL